MPAPIHAVLGPTNTGKTHYALTRMMAHSSGMIGFPLRLLARENYERLVSIKGKDSVALLTGEEKIIPPKARWFSCTVEAMPLDRVVDFVGIDEIQLAADPDRGHVFTDRLLHARGRGETLFLGAETIRGLLKKLIPGITIETRERLSQLSNLGPINLTRLPARSAIVAFSVTDVYAIAEAIRQKRGGCAVIMGRLSPRTRNAQVELYQNRDVDYLVATDAIGMGLNMDVDHVALASLRKFDGLNARPLTPQEVAQITGRAGRGMKDGTFGTTGTCAPMSAELIEAVEEHRFDPVRQIYWRQTQLDYSSPEALLESLMSKPPQPGLVTGRTASDLDVLTTLIQTPEIRHEARGKRATSLLWETCQIPDFRKLGDGSHARLCGRLFLDLLHHGRIPPTWLDGQLRGLDRMEGDIDTLMHRLSGVRVCAYVAARAGWMRNNSLWQERSREVEDRLSDTLHERLTSRFVNKRATALLRRPTPGEHHDLLYAVTPQDKIVVEGHEIGQISGFSLHITVPTDQAENALLLKAGKRALRYALPARIRAFLREENSAFSITPEGVITWQDAPIARLTRGKDFFHPDSRLLPGEFQDVTQMTRVGNHVQNIVQAHIVRRLKRLFTLSEQSEDDPFIRGLIHRLLEDGGMTTTLPDDIKNGMRVRKRLNKMGITIGSRFIFCAFLLKPALMPLMTLLYNLWHGTDLAIPPAGRKTLPAPSAKALPGWVRVEPLMIRADTLEHVLRLLTQGRQNARKRPAPHNLPSLLGTSKKHLPAFLRSLKIAHHAPQTLSSTHYGPAAPLMLLGKPKRRASTSHPKHRLSAKKARRQTKKAFERLQHSPFAALSQWKPVR
ncbi:helicase-related protein [Saccharibacter floricola]|uniref:DNA helicase n=1 Tax=Saccharibacter floricola DSM 15669 TaxID=1123227 RepID=A0ABQ0NXZ8_9PROT|nr:helicase-related protein [Saccharibacter floricola]GBQ06204.1 DNA helicase [Saccharibacter floricola DSM 15669]